MTAEVVIMNKNAVAIAADSAATLSVGAKDKISNTSNKLFRLYKNAQVGILVYSNSRINGIPWEVLIKDFRSRNLQTLHDSLEGYSNEFLDYLKATPVIDKSSEKIYVTQITEKVLKLVSNQIQNALQELISNAQKKVERQELIAESKRVLNNILEEINKSNNYEGITQEIINQIENEQGNEIYVHLSGGANDIEPTLLPIIHEIAKKCLYKENFLASESGIVITGYGNKDYFPALSSYLIYGILNGTVLYTKHLNSKITHEKEVEIIPFAQRDVVDTFITGIHPEFRKHIEQLVTENTHSICQSIKESDLVKNSQEIQTAIDNAANLIIKQVQEGVARGTSVGVVDILLAAKHLSMPELAHMAKTLVELTSFRRKVSMDTETVGGPVDVAVISKGDGYIWVERKHYFVKELNEHFFDGYSER